MSPIASEAPRMVSPRIMKERKPVKKGLRHEKSDGNDADVFLTALHNTQTHKRGWKNVSNVGSRLQWSIIERGMMCQV